jgi:hypothetical protein
MTGNRTAFRVSLLLQCLAVVSGLGAALLWFRSAAGPLPPMRMYWDAAPPGDPFYQAVVEGARLNRIAAFLTGSSVVFSLLSWVVATWIGRRSSSATSRD